MSIPGGDLCITSNEAFHLDKLPKRILVAGGGYIALEFAHIFHGLGSRCDAWSIAARSRCAASTRTCAMRCATP